MKTCTALVTGLFALASFPLWAQQSPPANQPNSPQQTPSNAEPAPPNSASASPQASTAQMSPVNGELVNKLDSKTAKTGDSVVVQIKTPVKTPDGTVIPKGSKLVGHVLAAQPSQAGQNSQMALVFDHVELKGGRTMPIHSQIQSISPAAGAASSGGPPAPAGATNGSQAGGTTNPSTSGAANGASSATQASGGSPGDASAANGGPAPGTVVAKNGQIAISTTSIPGVLVANSEPGQQDPRMADASSILLGARKDIDLDGGTLIVVGVAPNDAGTH
jgi:hypothetical protein